MGEQSETPNGGRPRVVWDMTFAFKSLTGTRVFAKNLYEALSTEGAWALEQTNAGGRVRTERTGNALTGAQNVWWVQYGLPRQLKTERADLIHAAAYIGPLRAACPMIVNVLDTTFLARPQDFDWKWRLYARTLIPPTVRRAAAIVTLSEHARSEIARAYDLPRETIAVVYPGVSAEFRAVRDATVRAAVRAKYQLPPEYILFVGAQEPRKNIPALVKALGLVRQEFRDLELVLVGPRGNGTAKLARVVNELGMGRVVHELGFVAQGDLPSLYSGARAFVYASALEGFGMPPVEAIACETPVVAAPNPPLPEVLGDGAWFTADDSPEALAGGITRVLRDEGLASELQRRGAQRAHEFTWERGARTTSALYRAVLANAHERVRVQARTA